MTDRGWMPLWSLSQVELPKGEFMALTASFTGEERDAIESARQTYTAQQRAIVVGIREAWEAKRQPKAVEYAVKWGQLYLGLDEESEAKWFVSASRAHWSCIPNDMTIDMNDGEYTVVREQV